MLGGRRQFGLVGNAAKIKLRHFPNVGGAATPINHMLSFPLLVATGAAALLVITPAFGQAPARVAHISTRSMTAASPSGSGMAAGGPCHWAPVLFLGKVGKANNPTRAPSKRILIVPP